MSDSSRLENLQKIFDFAGLDHAVDHAVDPALSLRITNDSIYCVDGSEIRAKSKIF